MAHSWQTALTPYCLKPKSPIVKWSSPTSSHFHSCHSIHQLCFFDKSIYNFPSHFSVWHTQEPITRKQHNSYWLAWLPARPILLPTAHYVTRSPKRRPSGSKEPRQIRQLSKRVWGRPFVDTACKYVSADTHTHTEERLLCTLHLM